MLYKTYEDSYYGSYRQKKFSDIYDNVEAFIADYKTNGIPATIKESTVNVLYYLLYANYGNSTIASSDINRFQYKLFSLIWQYGPTWEKRLDIQEKLRNLSDDEIFTGSSTIYNHAMNPGTEPSTTTLDELTYINDQNTTKFKKGKLEGYSLLIDLLKTDVTKEFIDRFKKLFLNIVEPEKPLLYITED